MLYWKKTNQIQFTFIASVNLLLKKIKDTDISIIYYQSTLKRFSTHCGDYQVHLAETGNFDSITVFSLLDIIMNNVIL